MLNQVKKFNDYRSGMNEKLPVADNKVIKGIVNLYTNVYSPGPDPMPEELPGLVSSAVLRCEDCVTYPMQSNRKEGAGRDEFQETPAIATLPDGTIVIPHLRRAFEYWELPEGQQG